MRQEAKATLPSEFPGALKLAAGIIATSTVAAAFPAVATAQAEAEHRINALHERVEAYQRAWNTHDPMAVAAFFTQDADFVMGNLPAARGRQQIRDWWQDYFIRQEPERRLTLDVSPVRFVTPDVAVITVAATTGGRDGQGRELPARRSRGTWVLLRQSDSWLISAMHGLPTGEDRVVLNPSLDAAEALRPQIGALVDAYEGSTRTEIYERYLEFDSLVREGSVTPHWMADGSRFWYAEGTPENTVIYTVDPEANTKAPLFDTERLRAALESALGNPPPHRGVPFSELEFTDDEKVARFAVGDDRFALTLSTYELTPLPADTSPESPKKVRDPGPYGQPGLWEIQSPDGHWFTRLDDHNLWVRSAVDGRRVQLTEDGTEESSWVGDRMWTKTWAWWSPDGSKLAVTRESEKGVPQTPTVHWLEPTPTVEWQPATHAGGPIQQVELHIVDVATKQRVRVDTGAERDQYLNVFGWLPSGKGLLFSRRNRQHTTLRLELANPETGAIDRVLVSESTDTFFPPEWSTSIEPTILKDCLIWPSERDGWNHLYVYTFEGKLLRQLTSGEYPVQRVVTVDEQNHWVYFSAHDDQSRPYDTHLWRVKLNGAGLQKLTEGSGQHDLSSGWTPELSTSIQFSPSKSYFIDTRTSPTQPSVVSLRKANGELVRTLSTADISALEELGWTEPEPFVVTATDGETPLHGILYKPFDFDPKKKYPVVEWLYAGPQTAWVAQGFVDFRGYWPHALAQQGFIVVVLDGRGTPQRGKRFQDVVYRNFGRHEIPEHAAALKQVAKGRRYMDMSRVGVVGASWGGYMTLRALFLAPDVYHVGAALAPLVEATTRAEVHEPYMGLPENNPEGYAYASNLRLADALKGKLLLGVGTTDGVFSETMKMADALIGSNKEFELVVIPEQAHNVDGSRGKYLRDSVARFLRKHLKP